MKGSIWKSGNRWLVGVWWQGKQEVFSRYKGEILESRRMAEKLLSLIQGRIEQHLNGQAAFRVEEFKGKGQYTDINDFYENWMKEVIEPKRSPGTIHSYWVYFKKHLKPFFSSNPVMLHELNLNHLTKLLNHLKTNLTGQGALNVMRALRAMCDYAWRCGRIQHIPPFPKKDDFNIPEKAIDWKHYDKQMEIINNIPERHRPIFLFLALHMRRPCEGCSIHKVDYDRFSNSFIIRRSISNGQLTNRTKTGKEHIMPCADEFLPYMKKLLSSDGPYLFVNPNTGNRYTGSVLNRIWKQAVKATGEKPIRLYNGVRHSTCSQYVNDRGMGLAELQELTGHKELSSLKKYATIDLERKRQLMRHNQVATTNLLQDTRKP